MYVPCAPPNSSSMIWSAQCLVRSTNHEAHHYALFPALCSMLPLRLKYLLGTLLSNTVSLYCYLNVKDQVSHPYKTAGKIIALYIVIFIYYLVNRKVEDSGPNVSRYAPYLMCSFC
jgi:hypothetical protein